MTAILSTVYQGTLYTIKRGRHSSFFPGVLGGRFLTLTNDSATYKSSVTVTIDSLTPQLSTDTLPSNPATFLYDFWGIACSVLGFQRHHCHSALNGVRETLKTHTDAS